MGVAVPRSEAFPHALAGLLAEGAYPHPVRGVELVQTHMSWVLLTGDFAYKIKRSVHYPFVDLRAPAVRAHLCAEELRLNRRFAPELYLAVCSICEVGGRAVIDGPGPVIEYAVRMRQFERTQELDALLRAGSVEPAELEAFGVVLAQIHAQLPQAQPPEVRGTLSAVRTVILANVDQAAQACAAFGARPAIEALRARVLEQLDARAAMIAARWVAGRVRECHGDLHARNIVRLEGRLVAFDCLEFEPSFRWIDVADELAMLLADLDWRGQPRLAHAFLGGYLTCSGDYQALRVLPLYRAHRALVRAKVAALNAEAAPDALVRESWCVEMDALVDRAGRALRRQTPRLLVLCGLPGSGKTWLSQALGARLGAVLLRSDVERRRLAGLAPRARSGSAPGAGLYTSAASAAVYEHLAQRAQDVLGGGFTAIVDASFALQADRSRMAELAARLGARSWLIHCRAPEALLQQRLAQRQRADTDASEADAAVLAWQQQRFEPIEALPGMTVIEADTADGACVAQVMAALHPPAGGLTGSS
jgi:aminoglycoside phosphotransferase family enzyme/predicted kinase